MGWIVFQKSTYLKKMSFVTQHYITQFLQGNVSKPVM